MRILIVYCHPYEKSYCNAVLKSVLEGINPKIIVDLIDLYKENFNPVMSSQDLEDFIKGISSDEIVIEYQKKIKDSDHLIFIFPIWWELMPAQIKGFLDRILTKGFAFNIINSKPIPKMVGNLKNIKGITLITTMETPTIIYKFKYGNAVKKAFYNGTMKKIGIRKFKWFNIDMVKEISEEKRRKWLKKINAYTKDFSV